MQEYKNRNQYNENEEYWDVYDENRMPTGKLHRRGEPMQQGEYHIVIHVCVFNSKGELLLQQRQPFKEGWSNLWDLTVGGSAIAGETSQMAAARELKEEVGISYDFNQIQPNFTFYFEHGFDDYYLITYDTDADNLKLQPEEVRRVRWMKKEEVLEMDRKGLMVPYDFLEALFQLKNHKGCRSFDRDQIAIREIDEEHLDAWMNLIEVVRDVFPGLETEEKLEEHRETVKCFIRRKEALGAFDGNRVVGMLLISSKHNMICFLAVNPDYRRRGIAKKLMLEGLSRLNRKQEISVTTFCENDERGKAPRSLYQSLGFLADRLTTEFGETEQCFILPPLKE